MAKKNLFKPIDLALLQAYLLEIFDQENKCEKSFKFSEWYLENKFNSDVKNSIFEFFNRNGINCDCEIIQKINSEELLDKENLLDLSLPNST